VCHPPSARNDLGNTPTGTRAFGDARFMPCGCVPWHGDLGVCAVVRDYINFADYISTLIAAPTPKFFGLLFLSVRTSAAKFPPTGDAPAYGGSIAGLTTPFSYLSNGS
jgi:hypothetical protein